MARALPLSANEAIALHLVNTVGTSACLTTLLSIAIYNRCQPSRSPGSLGYALRAHAATGRWRQLLVARHRVVRGGMRPQSCDREPQGRGATRPRSEFRGRTCTCLPRQFASVLASCHKNHHVAETRSLGSQESSQRDEPFGLGHNAELIAGRGQGYNRVRRPHAARRRRVKELRLISAIHRVRR